MYLFDVHHTRFCENTYFIQFSQPHRNLELRLTINLVSSNIDRWRIGTNSENGNQSLTWTTRRLWEVSINAYDVWLRTFPVIASILSSDKLKRHGVGLFLKLRKENIQIIYLCWRGQYKKREDNCQYHWFLEAKFSNYNIFKR